jgi:hypothetical protein
MFDKQKARPQIFSKGGLEFMPVVPPQLEATRSTRLHAA